MLFYIFIQFIRGFTIYILEYFSLNSANLQIYYFTRVVDILY